MTEVTDRLLTPSRFNRPALRLQGIFGIVMHWVENPGTNADFNWRWLEMKKDGAHGHGSYHYLIDDASTLRLIPDLDVAYHAGPSAATSPDILELFGGRYPNQCTIGVALCHENWAGMFSAAVYDRAVDLVSRLRSTYGISARHIIRHYDCTGKDCPRYWVDNPAAFHQFISDTGRGV